MAYILGRKEFFSRNFRVTPNTLIPRPETELLVETILDLLPESSCLTFADIGTGSGCIGITLALERKLWRGLLLDISLEALEVAKFNAQKLDAISNLACVQADMFSCALKPYFYDIIVGNPPYIAESEKEKIMADVRDFEPHGALFSPHDGMGHLKAIVHLAKQVLKNNGMVFVEHGADQGKMSRELFTDSGFFDKVTTLSDLAGFERCTYAVKK